MPPGVDDVPVSMNAASTRRPAGWFSAAALRAELAPQPGRAEASTRMLIACLLIVTISMALQIPNAALSAYMVFFVAREDMATTTSTGIALIAAVSVAIGLTLTADLVTLDVPALRLGLMTVLFCAGMYLSRVFVAGALGFGLGFILLMTQSTADLYPAAEPLVRDTLWTWMALFFSIAIVVVINVLLLPARPLELLRQEARLCLASVIDALDARLTDHARDAAADGVVRKPGGTRLAMLLKLASGSNPQLKARLPHYTAVLAALNQLVDASAMLSTLPVAPTPATRAQLAALRLACARLLQGLDGDSAPVTPTLAPPANDSAGREELLVDEMEHHLREIARLWPTSSAQLPAPAPARRLFVADALSNPDHLRFALKATFASMLCYVLYTALDWPGIHTCVITCAVVALTSTGATIHKATLRLAGALAGGALALLATVFVVPHLESIGGLLLAIAPVVAASAWIAAGSERTAYFGWQLAFAFFLCTLHGYAPNDDVTLVRDRLVGILLGIAVMGVVFNFVWPEHAGARLRMLLARAVRASAALLERDAAPVLAADRADAAAAAAAAADFAARRSAILADLADAERLAGVAAFETAFAPPHAAAQLAAAARRATVGVLHLARLDAPPADDGAAQLEHTIAGMLRQAADGLARDGRAAGDAGGAANTANAAFARLVAHEQLELNLQPRPGDAAAR